MRRRRLVIAAAALLLGVLAGGIAYAYLTSVQQRAYHDAELTSVYVASGTIPRGTTGAAALSEGLVRRTEIPTKFRPPSALDNLTPIASDVAVADIAQNQILVTGQFVANEVTGGAAAQQIPKGDVAISVSVDAVHGVAGLVAPGDEVDILVQLTTGSKEVALYQDVPVLATGSVVASSPGSSGSSTAPSSGLLTFAVPLDAAERIAMVESGAGATSGSIYLALVPPGSPAAARPTIGSSDLIPASPVPT